jgi:hypothetical protein
MNICFESHFTGDVLERYAMGTLSSFDYGPLEEHLLLCKPCQTRLMELEEFVLVIRAALTQLAIHPQPRFTAQSAYAL